MKTVFKHFSKKTLSMIVAFAVIICSFGTTFSAFINLDAEAAVGVEHFEVTYGSPAVPMFEKTTINLYDLKVQFEKNGAFVDGTDITWSAEAGSSAAEFLNATSKTFTALGTGMFKVTATETANSANTKTIYILVNEQDDFDFVLESESGLDVAATFDANDWVYGVGKTSSNYDPENKGVYLGTQLTAAKFNNPYNGYSRILYYKSDILKDFSDYTLSANMKIAGENGPKPFRGVVTRVQLNDAIFNTDGTLNTSATDVSIVKPGTAAMYLMSFNFAGLQPRGYYMPSASETASFTNTLNAVTYHTVEDVDTIKIVNRNPSYVLSTYSDSAISAVTSYRNLTYKLEGNNVVYSIDGNVILDTTKSTIGQLDMSRAYDNVLGGGWNVEGKVPEGGDFDHVFTEQPNKTNTEINSFIDSFGADKGTFGFVVSGRTGLDISSFKVTINGISSADDMPRATAVELETVANGGMVSTTVNTTLDLSNYIYAFDSGAHIGTAVEFVTSDSNASVNETYLTLSGKKFIATQAGVYAITASFGTETIAIQVFVQETASKELYKVSDRSPAVPMYVNTKIDLNALALQFKNGLYYYGRDVAWSIDESNSNDAGLVLSDTAKTLAAIDTGVYTLKATVTTDSGAYSRKVYFIVNKAGDSDFYLVDLNLAAGGFNVNEWSYLGTNYGYYGGATKFTVKETPSTALKAEGVCAPYGEGNLLVYKNAALMDFADYTIESQVVSKSFFKSVGSQFGIVGRVNLDFNAAIGSNSPFLTRADGSAPGLGVVSQPFGSPMLQVFNKSFCGTAVNVWEKYGYNTVSNMALITPSTANSDYVLFNGNTSSLKTTNVELKFDGLNIKYSFNGNVLLDTSAATINVTDAHAGGREGQAMADSHFTSDGTLSNADFAAMLKNNATTGSGTIALFNVRTSDDYVVAKTLKVKINNATVPAYTEYNPYIVKSSSPALPLTAGTMVSTGDFMIQLGAFAYEASALTFSAVTPVQNGAVSGGVVVEGGEIKAYKRGVYAVTATANDGTGRSQKIYIVVKNADEDEYVIYDKDYRTSGVDVSDWTTTFTNDTGTIYTNGAVYTLFETKTWEEADIDNYSYTPDYDYRVTSVLKDGIRTYSYYKKSKDVTLNTKGNYAEAITANGFVPFDATVLTKFFAYTNGSGWTPVYTYTVLDNEVINTLTDYTITASIKGNVNARGGIAILGRVNGTLGYGFGAGSKGAYDIPGAVPLGAPFAVTGTTFGKYTDVADITNYYYNTVGFANAAHRTYTIKYSGNTMTLTAPNGASKTISGISTAAGKVGFASYSKDMFGGYSAVPNLAEFKVSLRDIDISNLIVSNISGYTGEGTTNAPTYNEDASNIKFTLNTEKQISGWALIDTTKKNPQKIVIPSTVDGTKVSAVTYRSFQNVPYLGELVFEDGIRSILDAAFASNKYLDKITLPETLENINESAFSTTGVIDLVIPSSTLSIGKLAFNNSYSLHTLTIGSEADKTERLYMSQLKTIGDSAFKNSSVLEVVELPMNFKNLGANAFNGATSLKEIYFYNKGTIIGTAAIPATTTIYGATGSTAEEYANANGNPFVAIDSEIAAVEQAYADYLAALEAAAQLKAQTVDTNAVFAFYKGANDATGGVAGLTAANPNAGKYVLPLIGSFYNTVTQQEYKDFNVTYVKANAFKECDDKANIYNVVIPEGYTEIQSSAFAGCTNLRYLTLPNTLNFIRTYAFENNGWLKSVAITQNVVTIEKSAFQGAGRLETVTFADGAVINTLGDSAFQGTAIKTIKLPVLLRKIGAKAFADTPLTDVYIYNRDAVIGADAFPAGATIHGVAGSTAEDYANANGLTFVADITDTWDATINRVDPNGKFTYRVSGGKYAAAAYSAGGSIVIPQEIDFVASDTTVTKGALISIVGVNMFKNLNNRFQVTALIIPEGVTTVQDSSFIGCSNLVKLVIPESLQKIEQYAFSSADIRGTLEFSINFTYIGQSAFSGNTGIDAVYFYNPKCEIGDDAFKGTGAVIYGLKDSTAETYASKNDHEFVEIEAKDWPEIKDITDNGNYTLIGEAETNSVIGYNRNNENKAYSEKVIFPSKLNGADMFTIKAALFKEKPYTTSLVAVVIEEGYTTIGDNAFAGASRLVKVQIPTTLTTIGNSAFADTALAGDLILPESVTKIGGSAFAGCTNLNSVTISNPTATIGPNAFSEMTKGFTIRGYTNSTAEEYYTKYKKYGIKFEAIGEYVDPNAPSGDDENPGEGSEPGEEDPNNGQGEQGNNNQNNNQGNNNQGSTTTIFGSQVDDMTLIILIALGALMLILLLAGAVVIIIVMRSDDDDDEDYDDDEDDEDEDDEDYDDEEE